MTLIRGYNDSAGLIPEYAEMANRGNAHFIELKSYMHVGRSTNRLEYSNTLSMPEVRAFAGSLAERSGSYSTMDESEMSRIVVLQNTRRPINRWIAAYQDTN